jgi:NADPH:quinone reductase-like Zn-dependent oxidoreductase
VRAIVQNAYGDPADVLQLRDDAPIPALRDDGVLIRVRATSVNAGDWRKVRASPVLVRFGGGMRRPRDQGVGVDVAGEVEAVGPAATGLAIGDRVFGMVRSGAFAEYVTEGWFERIPAGVTFEAAAAVPAAACTALQAVRDHGQVRSGQRMLVNGAGGGVGTFVVQVARAFGAEVTAVSTADKADALRLAGAPTVIDRALEDFTKAGRTWDVVVDVGGALDIGRALRTLSDGGRLVLVGAGRGPGGPLTRFLGAALRSAVRKQPVTAFIAAPAGFGENLRTVAGFLEDGSVAPVIDRVVPLAEAAAAIRYVETGAACGKVVITI